MLFRQHWNANDELHGYFLIKLSSSLDPVGCPCNFNLQIILHYNLEKAIHRSSLIAPIEGKEDVSGKSEREILKRKPVRGIVTERVEVGTSAS